MTTNENKSWTKLTVKVDRKFEELVSACLINAGAQGVEIEDTADYLTAGRNLGEFFPEEIEQTSDIKLSAYYPGEELTENFFSQFRSNLTAQISVDFEIGTKQLEESDWENGWKQYFKPVRISKSLTIVPSWTDYEKETDSELLIQMDPGMAFGTGTHPTTRLSLYALEQTLRDKEAVLDVGTGSGVLAIAASLLGAEKVYAYDLDEIAVRVARENVALNPQIKNIEVSTSDLLSNITQEADVIVANILADILLHLLDDAYRLLKDGGYLILSGIIEGKKEEVLRESLKSGFTLELSMQQGEWQCLILKKTSKEMTFG